MGTSIISNRYRVLVRRSGDDHKVNKKFNRFVRRESHEDHHNESGHPSRENRNDKSSTTSDSSTSSNDSDVYVPGLLDDPGMVLGMLQYQLLACV
jgi:hypothetical protein